MDTTLSRSGGEEKKLDQLFITSLALMFDRIQRLDDADSKDLFDAILSLREDPSEENRAAVHETIEEILCQNRPSVQCERSMLQETPASRWSNYVATAVKKFRKESGLTQIGLASASGLQQSHISRIEKGEISPTRKTIEAIARGLGVDVSELDPCGD